MKFKLMNETTSTNIHYYMTPKFMSSTRGGHMNTYPIIFLFASQVTTITPKKKKKKNQKQKQTKKTEN